MELNLAGFDFLGDHYAVIDCPGSLELITEGEAALPAVDLAVIVADPDPLKANLVQPMVRQLEMLGVPRALFVNRMDQARGPIDALLAALAPVSSVPLVARQLPIVEGEHVNGFVDLALERAYVWRPGQRSELVEIPPDLAQAEADARFHMLEQLADFDDTLMEQLLADVDPNARPGVRRPGPRHERGPDRAGVLRLGPGRRAAIGRLLKALRHETPAVRSAPRLASGRQMRPGAYVLKASHAGQAGKLAYARVFGAPLADSADLVLPTGEKARAGGLFSVHGASTKKISQGRGGRHRRHRQGRRRRRRARPWPSAARRSSRPPRRGASRSMRSPSQPPTARTTCGFPAR